MNTQILAMQVNGELIESQQIKTKTMRSQPPTLRLLDRCHEILHDHLPETFVEKFEFTARLCELPTRFAGSMRT